MENENRFYLTACELSDLMGISIGHAYKLIRDMNAELAKEGYIVVAGKVPKRVRRLSLVLLGCFFLIYIVVIGEVLLNSLGGLFL